MSRARRPRIRIADLPPEQQQLAYAMMRQAAERALAAADEALALVEERKRFLAAKGRVCEAAPHRKIKGSAR